MKSVSIEKCQPDNKKQTKTKQQQKCQPACFSGPVCLLKSQECQASTLLMPRCLFPGFSREGAPLFPWEATPTPLSLALVSLTPQHARSPGQVRQMSPFQSVSIQTWGRCRPCDPGRADRNPPLRLIGEGGEGAAVLSPDGCKSGDSSFPSWRKPAWRRRWQG